MTALAKYVRLESPGLWHEATGVRGLNVVVGFREATLVLSDPKSDLALSHWSLPAVHRLNPGTLPALYAPGPDADETLEIDDTEMIAALETVHRVLVRRQARPGRLRAIILAGATILTLGLGFIWIPGALVQHTASVLPEVSRTEIGRAALAEMTRLTGPPCAARLGTLAAATLAERVLAPGPATILVVRDGVATSLALPGGLILLAAKLVETAPHPEALAGHVLAATLQSTGQDPMIPLLQHAGVAATFRLLTSGKLPEGVLAGYAETLLRTTPDVSSEALLERFRTARVPSSPYAYALDPTGETVLSLIEADPYRDGTAPPVLSAEHWSELQRICAE